MTNPKTQNTTFAQKMGRNHYKIGPEPNFQIGPEPNFQRGKIGPETNFTACVFINLYIYICCRATTWTNHAHFWRLLPGPTLRICKVCGCLWKHYK